MHILNMFLFEGYIMLLIRSSICINMETPQIIKSKRCKLPEKGCGTMCKGNKKEEIFTYYVLYL